MPSHPTRRLDWDFPVAAHRVAQELRLPFTRVYNNVVASGSKKIETEEQLHRIVFQMLSRGLPASALVKVFGPTMTLGQLAKLEVENKSSE